MRNIGGESAKSPGESWRISAARLAHEDKSACNGWLHAASAGCENINHGAIRLAAAKYRLANGEAPSAASMLGSFCRNQQC